jgi:hypothetical protein
MHQREVRFLRLTIFLAGRNHDEEIPGNFAWPVWIFSPGGRFY